MHNLEMSDGQVAFALRGAPAWHGLANATFDADAHVTTREMIDAALLSNWNVRLESISDAFSSYNFVSEPYLVVRDNPFGNGTDVLSTVGERYTVVQNEDVFEFGDAILDGGASWESAGSIRNGRTVFGSLVIPHNFTIDGEGIAGQRRALVEKGRLTTWLLDCRSARQLVFHCADVGISLARCDTLSRVSGRTEKEA